MRERKIGIDYVKGSRRLKALRKEKGYSHQQLAAETKINKQSLINYEKAGESERGERVDAFGGMSINSAAIIAKTLDVSSDYLLGLTDIRSPCLDIRSICEYTGLSEAAVCCLHNLKSKPVTVLNQEYTALTISEILEGGTTGIELFAAIAEYLEICKAEYELIRCQKNGTTEKIEDYDITPVKLIEIQQALYEIKMKKHIVYIEKLNRGEE